MKLIGFLKLREIPIARAARTKVIEPFFRFRERHPMRRHAFQNLGRRASDAFGIRKLCEQTPAQRMQDALFFLRGIWLVTQRSSPRIRLNPKRLRMISNFISGPSCLLFARAIAPSSRRGFSLILGETSSLFGARSSPGALKFPSMNSHIAARSKPVLSTDPYNQ